MKKDFFKRKTKNKDCYEVEIKYCDWSLNSDICLAKYKQGSYYIQLVGQDYKIIKSIELIKDIIKRAKEKGLLIPKDLLERIK